MKAAVRPVRNGASMPEKRQRLAGYAAFHDSMPKSANPHPPGLLAVAWAAGWEDAAANPIFTRPVNHFADI